MCPFAFSLLLLTAINCGSFSIQSYHLNLCLSLFLLPSSFLRTTFSTSYHQKFSPADQPIPVFYCHCCYTTLFPAHNLQFIVSWYCPAGHSDLFCGPICFLAFSASTFCSAPTAVPHTQYKLYVHLTIAVHIVSFVCFDMSRGAGKSLARPGKKQATATEDF
jgi:hypothetical protein